MSFTEFVRLRKPKVIILVILAIVFLFFLVIEFSCGINYCSGVMGKINSDLAYKFTSFPLATIAEKFPNSFLTDTPFIPFFILYTILWNYLIACIIVAIYHKLKSSKETIN
tara:strand:- start:3264 stop:3596 length:333 start_codon:yes stop_codon:yes gene_type:complete